MNLEGVDCIDCAWERAGSLSDAAQLMAMWLRGEAPGHPGYEGGPADETAPLVPQLLTLTACGVVPVNSQPGSGSTTATAGYPTPGAEAWVQRSYLELIGPHEVLSAITDALAGTDAAWAIWETLPHRHAVKPSSLAVDMVVTARQRTEPPDPSDPYFEANLLTFLNPPPYGRYMPGGMHRTDGSMDLADLGGLDPRVWDATTRVRSNWTVRDLLPHLRIAEHGENEDDVTGTVLPTLDLVCSLRGAYSATLVDKTWGRSDWLVSAAADAATAWLVERSASRGHD